MIGNKIKKILSITGATIAVSGVGLGIVIEHLKNNKNANNSNINIVSQNILRSGDNIYNLSAALVTKEINDTYYKFKLAIAGTNGLIVSNRNFYELYDNKTYVNKPIWEVETNSYVYFVYRTNQEKVVSFSYDIQLPSTEKVTIVANDFVVRPIFNQNKLQLSANLTYVSNAIQIVDVELNQDNYEYYDSLKLTWERRYDIPGTSFSQIETSLFDSEKIFSKEFCGKYIRVFAVENILAPVGLYKNGAYHFSNFEVGKIGSNQILITPGMLSDYKLTYDFIDYHKINLKAEFNSNNSVQKENDYQILFWEYRKNFEEWKSIDVNKSNLIIDYDLDNTIEYRFIYRLKNGGNFDISYSNVQTFEGINNLKIEKENNTIFVNLPEFINKYQVEYSWYISFDQENYTKLDATSNELLIDENNNVSYKLVLNLPNIFDNFELSPLHISNEIVNDRVIIEFSNSFIDAITVKASTTLTDKENVNYVWGTDLETLKGKTGKLVTLIREATPKIYWVFAVYNNKVTEKTYFEITEAFKPLLSVEQYHDKVIAKINNQNLRLELINYTWYKSFDNKKFMIIDDVDNNVLDLSNHPDAKFVKVKLTYVQENDITISSPIAIL